MKTIVIKCGGSVLEELSEGFFKSIQSLIDDGYQPVVVHGGGLAINKMLELHQIEPNFHNGLRVTCEKTMEVVEMVLSGKTNRMLVSLFERYGMAAIGLNGSDGKCLVADYIDKAELGLVGHVTMVNTTVIRKLANDRLIPVMTPVGISHDGSRLNINADYAAAAVAKALDAERCLFVTNVDGLMIEGNLIHEAGEDEIKNWIAAGDIYGGMIPKVESALSVLQKDIDTVMIVPGNNGFYSEGKWKGTAIVKKAEVAK